MGTLLLIAFALPAYGKTHKATFTSACGEVWAAVKDTIGNTENYTIKVADETRMMATYNVKHSTHVSITGALRQRPNTVSLAPQGNGCEVSVQSSYSGYEHDDAGDFNKRLNEALVKRRDAKTEPQQSNGAATRK
ncbi:hypothetical protein [Paludibaculum fermentans]|uniref:hypothetical protein n=1 Tax=Paludibaculum fermentans TaxID=1473598 RepID=UPI003EBA511C